MLLLISTKSKRDITYSKNPETTTIRVNRTYHHINTVIVDDETSYRGNGVAKLMSKDPNKL